MRVEKIPQDIINQANHILNSKSYSSTYRREVIRILLGTCAICDGIPNRYVYEKQDGIEVVRRYCDKHG